MNEFIELVNAMRKAQRRYKMFGTRESKFECDMLEREVDFQLSKYIKEDKIFFLVMTEQEILEKLKEALLNKDKFVEVEL